MAIVLNGTSGITNDSGYTGDGVSFADSTPANTLVTTSGGNVGIGTSSPSYKLHISGGSAYVGLAHSYYCYSSDFGMGTPDSDQLQIFAGAGNGIRFGQRVSGTFTERARIDSSGNLLVGTTSAAGRCNFVNPNSGDSRPLYLSNTSGSATPNGSIFIDSANSGTSAWNFLQCFSNTATSQKAFIRGDGTFGSATSTYGGTSDVRIKSDIVDTSPKLEKLMQVRVVNYTRMDDASQSRELGVIAQELEQVFPGLVYETEVKDADGNVLCPDRKNVKYSVFVPMLIKAMQELKAEVDSLKAQINGANA